MDENKQKTLRRRDEADQPARKKDTSRRRMKAKLGAWLLVGALSAFACSQGSDDSFVIPFPDNPEQTADGGSSNTDAGMDASTDLDADTDTETDLDAGPDLDADTDTDADTDLDAGPDLDADTDADTDLDAGPDLDADTDADTDMDGGPDLDADTDTDADTDLDAGPDLDADTDADTDLDAGPDLDADTDLDAGPDTDADTDSGMIEGGAVCTGLLSNDAVYSETVDVDDSITVGGYTFTYTGQVGSSDDILVDITCGTGSVVSEFDVGIYTLRTYDDDENGKRISITNHSSSSSSTRVSIVVEDLPGWVDPEADAGPDGGVDGGTSDGGVFVPECSSSFEETRISFHLYDGVPETVGGYTFTYTGETSAGITVDIGCEASSSEVQSGVPIELYSEVTVPVDLDAMNITIEAHSSSATRARVSIETVSQ